MTLDEAIIHCEKVAEENEHDAKEYNRLAKLETYPSRKECESAYKRCCKCASEHRQLAEWLKDYKRLLKKGKWVEPYIYYDGLFKCVNVETKRQRFLIFVEYVELT